MQKVLRHPAYWNFAKTLDLKVHSSGSSASIHSVPARKLSHGEIQDMREGVASSGELQAVRAARESGGVEVEDVSACGTQRDVKAEIVAGICASRRGHAVGIAGHAG